MISDVLLRFEIKMTQMLLGSKVNFALLIHCKIYKRGGRNV